MPKLLSMEVQQVVGELTKAAEQQQAEQSIVRKLTEKVSRRVTMFR
jgi:hypothetical protein